MNFKIAKPTMEQIDKVADTYWKEVLSGAKTDTAISGLLR